MRTADGDTVNVTAEEAAYLQRIIAGPLSAEVLAGELVRARRQLEWTAGMLADTLVERNTARRQTAAAKGRATRVLNGHGAEKDTRAALEEALARLAKAESLNQVLIRRNEILNAKANGNGR